MFEGDFFNLSLSAPGESVAAFFQFKVEKKPTAGGCESSKHISIACERREQVCVSIEAKKEREKENSMGRGRL